jgi:hypothetical protein
MSYKEIYYQQYEKKKKELHNLMLNEFKKAEALRMNFTYVKKVILEKLKDDIEKSIEYKNENIKLLIEVHFSKHYYQRGFEDMIFDNELKDKYNDLESNLNFNSYHSFLKSLANYHVTKEIKTLFETYWSNLRSMYRLSKYEGYDSFKKFDLIQLDRDGNQAITKELKEFERSPNQIKVKSNQHNLKETKKDLEKNKQLLFEKFRIKDIGINVFESDDCYAFMVNQIFNKNTLGKPDFQKLFIEGKITENPVKLKCSTQLFAKLLHELDNYYDKFVIRHFLHNQKILTSNNKTLKPSNLSNAKSNSQLSENEKIYNDAIAEFNKIAKNYM